MCIITPPGYQLTTIELHVDTSPGPRGTQWGYPVAPGFLGEERTGIELHAEPPLGGFDGFVDGDGEG